MIHRYGMRLRGFSIGCQPKEGFIRREDDTTGKYHDIIVYDRELTEKELADYELDRLPIRLIDRWACDEAPLVTPPEKKVKR